MIEGSTAFGEIVSKRMNVVTTIASDTLENKPKTKFFYDS